MSPLTPSLPRIRPGRLLTLFTTVALVALQGGSLFADKITLKNGEELEGTVIRENEEVVVLEYAVSPSIIDEKSIPRSEIQTLSKTARDAKAFAKVRNIKPGENSLPVSGYEPLTAALATFLNQFPDSEHADAIRGQLTALIQEREQVKKGNIKWNNRWYTPKEAETQKYQIDGFRLFLQMREQAGNRNFIGALNAFDQLENKYPGCQSYPDAVEMAIALIQALNAEIDRVIPIVKHQKEQFDEQIVLLKERDKARTLAAHHREIAQAEAAFTAAQKAKTKWPPLLPKLSKSIEALRKISATEKARLEALPVAEMRSSIALLEPIQPSTITVENVTRMEDTLNNARTLWKENEMIDRLEPTVARVKKEAEAAEKAAKAAAAEEAREQEKGSRKKAKAPKAATAKAE